MIQTLANIEPITAARRPGAEMISRTATTRLVADILDLLDRDWIAWANVLELLAYAEVQSGKPWLEVLLRGSDPADRVRDWRPNKAAYLFPPHPTLLPECFPCSVDRAPTARLARAYEAVLHEHGLQKLWVILREGLMRPLLWYGGMLYRFYRLESREDGYHAVDSTEQYRIADPLEQRQPEIGGLEALHVGGGELTVRDGASEWHEPLAPGRTQLPRLG